MTLDMMAQTADQNGQNEKTLEGPGQRKRFGLGLTALAVLCVILTWVGASYDENMEKWTPETSAIPSAYNKKPSGVSGLTEIVKLTGITNRFWVLPYRELGSARGTLCIFSPLTSFKEFEVDQILQWVKAGNQLIYLDHFTYGLSRHMLDKLNIHTTDGISLKNHPIKQSEEIGILSHVPSLTFTTDTRLNGGIKMIGDKSGNLFTRVIYGKGEIILGTDPSLCANKRLTDKTQWGNFQLLINLCRQHGGEVIFDERCHGYNQASNVLVFLAKNPPGAVFAQLILMLSLAIFSGFHRFGKIKLINDSRRLSSLDFIAGLSSVYRRAGANLLALEIVSRAYRNRWCKTTGAPAHATLTELKETWTGTSRGNTELEAWCNSAGELLTQTEKNSSENKLSDSDLLKLIAELENADKNLNDFFTTTNKKGTGK